MAPTLLLETMQDCPFNRAYQCVDRRRNLTIGLGICEKGGPPDPYAQDFVHHGLTDIVPPSISSCSLYKMGSLSCSNAHQRMIPSAHNLYNCSEIN
jgi:hypothetical protein